MKYVKIEYAKTEVYAIEEKLWEKFLEKAKHENLEWKEITCVCSESPCSCTQDDLDEIECDDYVKNEEELEKL